MHSRFSRFWSTVFGLAVIASLLWLPSAVAGAPATQGITPTSPAPAAPGATDAAQAALCARQDARAQAAQARAEEHARVVEQAAPGPAEAPAVTNPSVWLYYVAPDAAHLGYSYISGRTDASIVVSARIWRGGRLLATLTTTSSSNGYFYFWPTWRSCPTSGYDWVLMSGDVVEVTAGGRTVSVTAVSITLWMDPVTNHVGGTAPAGTSLRLYAYVPNSANICVSTAFLANVTARPDGAFETDFSTVADFNRAASGSACTLNADGNGSCNYADAYGLQVEDSSVYGYLRSNALATVTLSRAGAILATETDQTDLEGWFAVYFDPDVQPGDVIEATAGGISVSHTVARVDAHIDLASNRAVGLTTGARPLRAFFYKRDVSSDVGLQTGCGGATSVCAAGISDTGGAFALAPTGLTLRPGDFANIYVYDAEGNYDELGYVNAPALVASPAESKIYGYWGGQGISLTVTLKDSAGAIKTTFQPYVSSWDHTFDASVDADIAPGDRIEATDGSASLAMTVQNLAARVNASTGRLTGQAPAGRPLVAVAEKYDFVNDWRRADSGVCLAATVPGNGAFDLPAPGVPLKGNEGERVWVQGADGHYTLAVASTFWVRVALRDGRISGYTETPKASVELTLWRGAVSSAGARVTSDAEGYFFAQIGNTTPVALSGDVLEVVTADSAHLLLGIPTLTVNGDPAQNRVYGQAPARQPVAVAVHKKQGYSTLWAQQVVNADAAGNYSALFAGLYWGYPPDCAEVDAGGRCTYRDVSYATPAGHLLVLETVPPPPPADAYEPDDTQATAKAYTGVQTHTFHATTDTDWVQFTVPAADANKTAYAFRFKNTNASAYFKVVFHNPSGYGMTLYIFAGDTEDYRMSPAQAGTYYLEIVPQYGSSTTPDCSDGYTLSILPLRGVLRLPTLLR